MSLKSSFFSSTTTLCYYAMDFADEELKLEHLAVRFKCEETLNQFKDVFEKCQRKLLKNNRPAAVKPETKKEAAKDKVIF